MWADTEDRIQLWMTAPPPAVRLTAGQSLGPGAYWLRPRAGGRPFLAALDVPCGTFMTLLPAGAGVYRTGPQFSQRRNRAGLGSHHREATLHHVPPCRNSDKNSPPDWNHFGELPFKGLKQACVSQQGKDAPPFPAQCSPPDSAADDVFSSNRFGMWPS